MLNSEGIGNVKIVFSETKAQQLEAKGKESSKVIAGNKGANVRDSPHEAQVQTKRFRSVLSFGQEGESRSVGMLNKPCGVAVNDQDEIAVAEFLNRRVSVFSSDGTHLRSFGRGTQRQFSENICSEDDLRSIIFGTFLVKFLTCLPLLLFSNIFKMV